MKVKKQVIFECMMAPGDVLVLTTAIRELHKTYPDQFETAIVSPYPEITYNNPYLKSMREFDYAVKVPVSYVDTLIDSRFSGKHMCDGFIEDINQKLGIRINKTSMFPEIRLLDFEKDKSLLELKYGITGKFWLFNAGCKIDMPLKAYSPVLWQEVIDMAYTSGIQLIQVGSNKDIHPEFPNVKSLVGKTENLRDYLALCYHAEGHIGAISLQMHVMAAFRKPCIIIAGGRENVSWEMYPKHQFLHSVGYLDCCSEGGCWRKQRNECSYLMGDIPYPLCMNLIKPETIVESLINYHNGNAIKGEK